MKPSLKTDPLDAAQARLAACGFKAGDLFTHYKGGRYQVVALCVLEATCEPAVAYLSLDCGAVWVRTLEDWCSEVEVDGLTVRRFVWEASADRPRSAANFSGVAADRAAFGGVHGQ